MKAFRVNGTFRMGKKTQTFTKEVISKDRAQAEEFIISDLGSKHRAKRYQIKITEVKELKPDEVSDHVVAFKLGGH